MEVVPDVVGKVLVQQSAKFELILKGRSFCFSVSHLHLVLLLLSMVSFL